MTTTEPRAAARIERCILRTAHAGPHLYAMSNAGNNPSYCPATRTASLKDTLLRAVYDAAQAAIESGTCTSAEISEQCDCALGDWWRAVEAQGDKEMSDVEARYYLADVKGGDRA